MRRLYEEGVTRSLHEGCEVIEGGCEVDIRGGCEEVICGRE